MAIQTTRFILDGYILVDREDNDYSFDGDVDNELADALYKALEDGLEHFLLDSRDTIDGIDTSEMSVEVATP